MNWIVCFRLAYKCTESEQSKPDKKEFTFLLAAGIVIKCFLAIWYKKICLQGFRHFFLFEYRCAFSFAECGCRLRRETKRRVIKNFVFLYRIWVCALYGFCVCKRDATLSMSYVLCVHVFNSVFGLKKTKKTIWTSTIHILTQKKKNNSLGGHRISQISNNNNNNKFYLLFLYKHLQIANTKQRRVEIRWIHTEIDCFFVWTKRKKKTEKI